jgi:ComF family protein
MRNASRCQTNHTDLLSSLARFSRHATDAAVAIVLGPLCAACHEPLDEPTRGAVCQSCWSAIVPITPPCCRTCGDPRPRWRGRVRLEPDDAGPPIESNVEDDRCRRCLRVEPIVTLARSVGSYEGSLRAIVHALKYDPRRTIARHLATRMRTAGAAVLAGADFAVPVPLHPSRERSRGFNQARELARHLGLPMVDALARTRKTASQADLPAARRKANVRGAFEWRQGEIAGSTIVLVDDVSTTGATLNACAAALMDAGATEVRALTAAKAVAQRP